MYTSIAYESGWTVYVDGVKTETVKFKDAMLAVPLTAGSHTIRMVYVPEGYHTGAALTAISIVLLVLVTVLRTQLKKHPISSPFIEDYYPEDDEHVLSGEDEPEQDEEALSENDNEDDFISD
jgi:hypothetical protein